MSHPNSNHPAYLSKHTHGAHDYLNDEQMRAANSDHMFNALMDQYLSQAPSSSSNPSTPGLSRHNTEPRTSAHAFQQVANRPAIHGHHHARQSPTWSVASSSPGYGPGCDSGHPNMPIQGSTANSLALHAGDQPSFSDLMREMGHEHSRALHEAALRAPYKPVTSTPSNHGSPRQGLTSSPGDYLYGRPSGLAGSPHRVMPSRSPSGSVSGGSSGAQPRSANFCSEDDALFEMFPCDMCSASFSRRHDLERHRRGHSGESPYVCEGCGGGFTRSDGRGRHWKLQPSCEALHFERGGSGKRRSGSGPGHN